MVALWLSVFILANDVLVTWRRIKIVAAMHTVSAARSSLPFGWRVDDLCCNLAAQFTLYDALRIVNNPAPLAFGTVKLLYLFFWHTIPLIFLVRILGLLFLRFLFAPMYTFPNCQNGWFQDYYYIIILLYLRQGFTGFGKFGIIKE